MLNGIKGWFVQSTPAYGGFAGDPTSLARDNIKNSHAQKAKISMKKTEQQTGQAIYSQSLCGSSIYISEESVPPLIEESVRPLFRQSLSWPDRWSHSFSDSVSSIIIDNQAINLYGGPEASAKHE